jgi:hypothetical protein
MCSSPSKITSLAIAAAVGIVFGMPRLLQAGVLLVQSKKLSVSFSNIPYCVVTL